MYKGSYKRAYKGSYKGSQKGSIGFRVLGLMAFVAFVFRQFRAWDFKVIGFRV